MKLRERLLVTALAVALPLTIVLFEVEDHLRDRERRLTLERFVTSQLTDDFRDRCESNPNWFLAGPRPDRPRPEVLAAPDADVTAPRPPTQELPIEYFAYDPAFAPMSSAGPRFPPDLRDAIRRGAHSAMSTFDARGGTGLQMAVVPGWEKSPCAMLLFRMRPVPTQTAEQWGMFLVLFAAMSIAALVAGGPIVLRVRRLGQQARQSASDEYRSTIDSSGRDEASALAFAFNEAASDIRRRAGDVKDREDSQRRYIANTAESVTAPLVALTRQLGDIERGAAPSSAVRQAVRDAHTLTLRIQNLSVAATLRMSIESPATDVVDLRTVIARVVESESAFAHASGVTVTTATGNEAVRIAADPRLIEQALNNLVDNAIRYGRAGGQTLVTLSRAGDGRFSLRIVNDAAVSPELIGRLNANRRFRGDEGRSGRPDEIGLGLAVVREVCDRFRIQWTFRGNTEQFEAELTGSSQ